MTNPLLILDEAGEGLAPGIGQDFWTMIKALKKAGPSIQVVDKTLTELPPLADRCVVMEKGCMVWQGALQALTPELQYPYIDL